MKTEACILLSRALTGMCVCMAMIAGQALGFEPMKNYQDAKLLMKARKFQEAKAVLETALKESREAQDFYFAFFFARDLAKCEETGGHILASIEHAQEALALLPQTGPQMSDAVRMYEQVLLEGAVSARYLDRHQISLARQWQRKTNQTLLSYIEKKTGQPYDLKSGALPQRIDQQLCVQIIRQLWHESRILEHEARTAEALACLEAAAKLFTARPQLRQDYAADDYYWKLLNMRSQLLDFLGFLPEAIALDRQGAEREITPKTEYSIQVARVNLSRNLSQYEGPSEQYLQDTLVACERIEAVSSPATSQEAWRVANKMVFDMTHDAATTQLLAEVEAALKKAGRQKAADYTERDQLTIAVKTGSHGGDGNRIETGLQRLLETFRDNGNRSGEVSLFRTYADFCLKSGRYDDALYLYTRCYTLTKQYGWYVHLPRIAERLARVQLLRGDVAEAERWLRDIQTTLAAHPDFPAHRRAEALALAADLLTASGKGAEGEAMRAQAVDLAKSRNVPAFWQRKLAASTEREVAKPAVAAVVATAKTDLQPRKVVSDVLPGETALARLTLANPTDAAQAGKLTYPSSAKVHRWDAVTGELHLEMRGDDNSAKTERTINLDASGMIHIFLEADVAGAATTGTAEIRWQPQNGAPQTAQWEYRATDEQVGVTVINANLAELNAFYYVPLYHVIRKRDDAVKTFDFSVVCSAPCYVEIVDAASGDVIAVDRQGDGTFDQKGDFVFQDSNGNLFPDHVFAEQETQFGIEIRVYPTATAGSASPDDITVTVMGAFDGQWLPLSGNLLKKNKPN